MKVTIELLQVDIRQAVSAEFITMSFTQIALVNRMRVESSTVGRNKFKNDFKEWSKARDPDQIGWRFSSKTNYYYPVCDVRLVSELFEQ